MEPDYKFRLLTLADFLDILLDSRFDINHWVDVERWEGKPDLSCGTTACSLGWATTLPLFQELGLKLFKSENYSWVGFQGDKPSSTDPYLESLIAAEVVFGLTRSEAEYLFSPSDDSSGRLPYNATARCAAAHIRDFVKKKYSQE